MKKHREDYPQNSGLKSAKAESQYKEIEHHDAMSKDALRKKTVESKSSNDAQMKETKSSSHSSKNKTQQKDSRGHVKSSVSLSSNKILGSEVKLSTLSSHKDSLHRKSTAGDTTKEIPESGIKRKRLDDKNGENSSKRQQYELSSKPDEEEMSDLEKNCLQNRELSSSLTQADILGEYSSKKNLREDGASPDDCRSERESSITNSSKVKSSSHKVSSKSMSHYSQSSSKSKLSSDRDSSLRDNNHAFKNTSEGSSSSKYLSEKKSHTSSQSRKTDSSVKASAKDISKDLSCKQPSVKRVSHKDVCAIGEDELSGSDFHKESLKKFDEPLEKHYIEKTDRKLPFKSSSKDSPVSKSADGELESFPRKDRHEASLGDGKLGHRSEKKLGDKNQLSRRNKSANSKPETKDSDHFDSSEENNFQLFFEDLSKVDSKSSHRKDDVRESRVSKSNESRNKSSKDFQDDHRSSSSSSSLSVPRRSHDSHERIGGSQDPVAKKKKPENEAKTGQKNREKQKSDDKFMLQQKDSSKSSGSHGQKSEKSTSHSLKILDKKSETKESNAGRVTFGNDAIDSDLESDDDGNSGMSFAACLEYNVSTPQKKKSATKPSKSSNVRIKDRHCKAEQLGGSILDQSLIDFPLPTEVVLDLEHEDLPLYPSMRQEFQSKMSEFWS